ncbi:acyl-CoA N-acyltransferase [Plectosphaerella plurivora]|uniref:Acyl-CoA N-acyltransferase n=1 Tax=Plectosphaerella plurivora TaxID=936078 RepID=A0A9P8V7H7_9PEZI|nr:acyl-CoA N-acyltransferase [Plectosphaerella plurivora]
MLPPVHPAESADAAAIADIFLRCFNDDYFQTLFPQNEHGHSYMKDACELFLTSKARGSQEGRLFVTRDDAGNVVGASLIWIVQPSDNGVWPWKERWPPANAGQNDALLDEFFTGMADQQEAAMGKRAHVYFELVFVNPSQHRKGHATALVQYAAALADALGYESYLDAEEDVIDLYIKQGYVARTDIEITSIMKPMVRPPLGGAGSGGRTSS